MAGIFNSQIFNNAIFNTGPSDVTNIRNFSLREWRRWTKKELEEGELPEELKIEAQQAVNEASQAATALASGRIEAGAALLQAMEARESYEQAYREAYASAYVAEIVAENWKRDMLRARRRRAAALLLLH